MKVFVVGPSVGYSRFIEDLELVDDMKDAQVVLFTGGEDINPELYGCKKHPSTWFNTKRDQFEVESFKKVASDQLCVGVCRGFQLFSAMYGGKLAQDVSGHWCGRSHSITNGKITYEITSLHHQMVYPFNLDQKDFEILYWAEGISHYYEGDGIDPKFFSMFGEPEVALFHREGLPTCLGVQGHPEMMAGSPVAKMINDLIRQNTKRCQ